jgi:septum formation protein
MSNPPVVLASTSKYRALLLGQLRIPFTTFHAEVNESAHAGELPMRTCARLAEDKARNAVKAYPNNTLIIGSDQVLDLHGEAVSKPGDFETALSQLKRARGTTSTCYTALALLDTRTGEFLSDVVPTHVTYRMLPDEELIRYLHAERPYDCAGAVKVEALGITLLERVVSDDPTALIGLPLIRLTDFLRRVGYVF